VHRSAQRWITSTCSRRIPLIPEQFRGLPPLPETKNAPGYAGSTSITDLAEREGLLPSAPAELRSSSGGPQSKNRSAALRAGFFIPVRFGKPGPRIFYQGVALLRSEKGASLAPGNEKCSLSEALLFFDWRRERIMNSLFSH